ncbi:MAG: hypothetical protein NTV88_01965 [Candidatus Micrarchaeota archaeon]|nr:hypothetical protein [Candidatus Micrarchaeota archaeon]
MRFVSFLLLILSAAALSPATDFNSKFLAMAFPLLAIVLVALMVFAAAYFLVMKGKKKGK